MKLAYNCTVMQNWKVIAAIFTIFLLGFVFFILRKQNISVQNDHNNLVNKTESNKILDKNEESPETMVDPDITDINSAREKGCANNRGVSDAYIEEYPVEGYNVIHKVIFLTCTDGQEEAYYVGEK